MSENSNKNNNKNKFNNFSKFDGKGPQPNIFRNMMLWLILAAGIFAVYVMMQGTQKQEWPVSYTEYRSFLDQDLIKSAKVVKSQLNDYTFRGELKQPVTVMIDGRPREVKDFVTKLGVVDSETEKKWEEKGITWTYEDGDNQFWGYVISFLPWILLIGLYIFFFKRMQGGGGGSKGIFSFGKSRAKLLTEDNPKVTFRDVAGADEAKYELEEVIEFLKEPTKFQKLGGKIPKGVLLLGPPGTGKTLLARAVSGEAGVPFYSISGADFVEMFVGVGASRVRDLFEQAKKSSPCIVFIDEIDAVGRHRGAGLGGGHDEREQTLNQLLVEMDGFEQNSGVIIIAATNRPDVLDPALLRPGRFDRQVVVDRPDVKGREGIFKVHTDKIPLGSDVDLSILAKGTPGLSGADIANIVNEAALLAARRNSDKVTMYDFENAKDKILMGIERKSMVISDKEKEMTAYHEMGHALVGKFLEDADPVHKVTIIPRGRALGVTSYLPNEDYHSHSKEYIEAKIVLMMGGRAAEKLVFDNLTTGASNDLQRATQLARKMVCDWGMSEALGPITFDNNGDEVFLGKEISHSRNHSEKTAELIDREIRKILVDCHDKAQRILSDNLHLLHKTSKILLDREILDGEELDMLIRGEELPPINKKTINAIRSMNLNGSDKENVKNNGNKTEKE
ncbi:MAG: ATP-dependent zinc metalloprotease FtsH [Candidatus Kapaibacterium sp.]